MARKPVLNKNKKYYKKSAKKYNKMGLKKSRFSDGHYFKLSGADTTIFSSGSNVTSTGSVLTGLPQVIPNTGNRVRFGGVFTFNIGSSALYRQKLYNMFDRVKINGVKVKVIPMFNTADTGASGTLPSMKVCYDFDDLNVPTPGDIQTRIGKTYRLDKPFSIYLKPKILKSIVAVQGTVTNTYINAPEAPPYLDMSNAGVCSLYGIKFMIQDWYNFTGLNNGVRFEITYYCHFKNQIAINNPITNDPNYSVPEGDVDDEQDLSHCPPELPPEQPVELKQ